MAAYPRLKALQTSYELIGFLEDLNESGTDYVVAGMDEVGGPFIAFLRGPYAETVGVLAHNPWDGEIDLTDAERPCDDCLAQGPIPPESLKYPVVVLVREAS